VWDTLETICKKHRDDELPEAFAVSLEDIGRFFVWCEELRLQLGELTMAHDAIREQLLTLESIRRDRVSPQLASS